MSSLNGFESCIDLRLKSLISSKESSVDFTISAGWVVEWSLDEISIDEPVHDVFSSSETSNDAV